MRYKGGVLRDKGAYLAFAAILILMFAAFLGVLIFKEKYTDETVRVEDGIEYHLSHASPSHEDDLVEYIYRNGGQIQDVLYERSGVTVNGVIITWTKSVSTEGE